MADALGREGLGEGLRSEQREAQLRGPLSEKIGLEIEIGRARMWPWS